MFPGWGLFRGSEESQVFFLTREGVRITLAGGDHVHHVQNEDLDLRFFVSIQFLFHGRSPFVLDQAASLYASADAP